MSIRFALCLSLAGVVNVVDSVGLAEKWTPPIASRQVYRFPQAATAEVTLPILDAGGQPLYLLECHSMAYGLAQSRPDFDYSGDFECRLTPSDGSGKFSTLLTEEQDPTRDWQSRARFLAPELRGKCGAYVDYGLVRRFRLRGMELALEMSDVTFKSWPATVDDPSELKSFAFAVGVRPDSTAISEIAETPDVDIPPSTCGSGYRGQPARQD